jgi:putative membrane protein insertion efficiency factor
MMPTEVPLGILTGLRRAPRISARALVKLYQFGISPLLGVNCRHLPSCSEYADESLSRFGLWAGGWMTLARLLRCQPWGTSGLDVVPAALPREARWYLPWRYARWRGTNAGPNALGDTPTRDPHAA